MKSLLTFAILATVAAQASASFDLTLLPGADGRVYRYDPANQVMLGSFGAGPAIKSIAIDPTRRTALVSRSMLGDIYDYSSGARMMTGSSSSYVYATYYHSAGDQFDVLFRDTVNNTSYLDRVLTSDGQYHLGPNLPTQMLSVRRYSDLTGVGVSLNAGTGFTVTRLNSSLASVNSVSFSNPVTAISPMAVFGGKTYFTTCSGATVNLFQVTPQGTGLAVSTALSVVNLDATQRVFVNANHSGLYLFGKDNASANWKVAEIASNGTEYAQYSTTVLNVGYTDASPDTFLAPEPSSLVAVCVGAVLLKRRSREKAK